MPGYRGGAETVEVAGRDGEVVELSCRVGKKRAREDEHEASAATGKKARRGTDEREVEGGNEGRLDCVPYSRGLLTNV